jgi:D-serine deaminase-like pyridoxal phosphate-dependent protein
VGSRSRAEPGLDPTVNVAGTSGITEVRPGNDLFSDLTQVARGVCSLADVGFWVLATVIGSYPGRGALVVDAGALALSKDPGPVHVDPGCGFGLAFPADGRTRAAPLRVESLTQEHGLLRVAAPLDLSAYPIGSRLRILPNHSCLAAACFDRYHLLRGDELVGEWRPCRGW